MLTITEHDVQTQQGRDKAFFRTLRVFSDGSRVATLTKNTWPPRAERVALYGAEAIQRRINAKAGRLPRTERSIAVAVQRAKKMVFLKVQAAGLDHMLTLTYRENMQDRARLVADWTYFVKLVHAKFPSWPFVAVPEKQERGAWHIHAAVKGWQDVKFLRKMWHRVVGQDNGNIDVRGEWRRGRMKKTKEWSKSGLAGYLSKYIGKSFADSTERDLRRYWPSKGIDVPEGLVSMVDAETWEEAVVSTFGLVADETMVSGVRQWADKSGFCYWIYSPQGPKPPF